MKQQVVIPGHDPVSMNLGWARVAVAQLGSDPAAQRNGSDPNCAAWTKNSDISSSGVVV
ncbi:MAG: hypothetical protein PHH58_00625 [Rhodoferax sp.]|nr:hypothetical protein [Rhodoferax sp.]